MKDFILMHLWSAKGAKRGCILAMMFAVLWAAWTIAYTQPWHAMASQKPHRLTLSHVQKHQLKFPVAKIAKGPTWIF